MRIFAAITVSCLVASSASAKDLPEKLKNLDDSMSGAVVERIANRVAKASDRVQFKESHLHTALDRSGLKTAQAQSDADCRASWKLEEDRDSAKHRFVRERVGSNGMPGRFGDLESYARKRPALDDVALVELGSKVLNELAAEVRLMSPGEELRPDSTAVLRHEGGDAEGKKESFVVAAELVMRRHVDGVPVLGPRGEARIVFDADGSVVEASLPDRSYLRGRAWNSPEPKASLPAKALSRLGVRPGKLNARRAQEAPKERAVKHFRCGYIDDEEGTELRAGCELLTVTPEGLPDAKVIMLD